MANSNFRLECRDIAMDEKYITMVKGDTLSFGVEIVDQDGVPMDVDHIFFTCRKTYGDTDTLFALNEGLGITRLSEGVYSVLVPASATGHPSVEPGLYVHDFRVMYGNDAFTVFRGVLEILPTTSR